jgi:hypothetical protein
LEPPADTHYSNKNQVEKQIGSDEDEVEADLISDVGVDLLSEVGVDLMSEMESDLSSDTELKDQDSKKDEVSDDKGMIGACNPLCTNTEQSSINDNKEPTGQPKVKQRGLNTKTDNDEKNEHGRSLNIESMKPEVVRQDASSPSPDQGTEQSLNIREDPTTEKLPPSAKATKPVMKITQEQLKIVNDYLKTVPNKFRICIKRVPWDQFCLVKSTVTLERKSGDIRLRRYEWRQPDGQNHIYSHSMTVNKYCALSFEKKELLDDVKLLDSSQAQHKLSKKLIGTIR